MINISIPVMAYIILERQEEFDLTLNVLSSLGPAITAGDRNTATAIMFDSTSKSAG